MKAHLLFINSLLIMIVIININQISSAVDILTCERSYNLGNDVVI